MTASPEQTAPRTDVGRVALFATCVNDVGFPETPKAVVRLLRRLGVEVDFPAGQTCCGQMHLNTGYRDEAARIARTYVSAFAGYDAVVAPSASCAAMIRHYHARLTADGTGADGNHRPQPPTYELSEFLVDVLGVTDVGAYFPHTVAYHPTCHSLRLLGVGDRPYELLRAVRGLTLVELDGSDQCCGFGGTFAMKNPDVSVAMGADKVAAIRTSGAEVVCAGDNSCLMHIGGLLGRLRTGVRTMHLAEILAATEERTPPAAAVAAPAPSTQQADAAS